MVGFIRTVIIIMLIWYAFRLIGRYVLPWLMKKGVQKMQNNMEEKFRNASDQNRPQQPEGNVSVEKKGNKSQSAMKDDVGEYVDFEEVE